MALKQCEYCRSFTDSKNTRCPFCSAPLNNKIIAEEGNIKETVALKVTETINKVIPSSSEIAATKTPASPYDTDYPSARPAQSSQTVTQDGKRMISKWIVLVLALVGGVFGIHRFYEGKFFTGVIYVLTFGFCGIGVVVDILCILGKPTTYPAKR